MKRIAVFSNLFFPNYVGGGERLAEMTAEGFKRLGMVPTVLTTGLSQGMTERWWQDTRVIEIPAIAQLGSTEQRLIPGAIKQSLQQCGAEYLHVVGVQAAAEVMQEAEHCALPITLATTDYSLICNTATLVRTGGTLCHGKTSIDDCFACRLEAGRFRDRTLATIGRRAPAARHLIKSGLKKIIGEVRGGQIDWWSDLKESERRRDLIWGTARAVIHGTKFAAQLHAEAAPPNCSQKNHYCHHPIGDVRPVSRRPSVSEDIVVGFIGRAIPIKGLHWLLNAVRDAEGSPRVRIVVYAPTNNDWTQYQDVVRKQAKDLGDRVEWRERGALSQTDLDEIHRTIDVLIVPSLWPEYVGLVTLEALARGTPVVLSDYPPQRELFGDLPQVRMVKPHDAETMISAIRELAVKFRHVNPVYENAPRVDEYAALILRSCGQLG